MRGAWLAGAALLLAGCATPCPVRPTPVSAPPPAQRDSETERLLARAADLARADQGPAAAEAAKRVAREEAGEPAARARALYGVGRSQARAGQFRAARAVFDRLLAEYPHSAWAEDGRVWRAVLVELLTREEEATTLRVQLERLKRIDLDLERRR